MQAHDAIEYHSTRVTKEIHLGLTTTVMAASRAHLQLATLHMQRLRELTGQSERHKPVLTM
jgi:hypothetical protein